MTRIVSGGLAAEDDLSRLGRSLKRVWKVDETPCFGSLLSAIDAADRDVGRERDVTQTGAIREREE